MLPCYYAMGVTPEEIESYRKKGQYFSGERLGVKMYSFYGRNNFTKPVHDTKDEL